MYKNDSYNIRVNNFDIIRLFAASQVMLFNHYARFFDCKWIMNDVMSSLAGVPIFFFISGFLISMSFENNGDILQYAKNRVLRIFPAWWVCMLVAILSVFASGYGIDVLGNLKQFIFWVLTEFSYPVYNPDFMRQYGVGVLNGSLWTVPVELEFYVLLPLIYCLLNASKSKAALPFILLVVLYYSNILFVRAVWGEQPDFHTAGVYYKMYRVMCYPHLWLFMTGILFQRNSDFLIKKLAGKFFILLPVFLSLKLIVLRSGVSAACQQMFFDLPLYMLLGATILSAAFSMPKLSSKLLRENDISYGIYIYHMPVANFVLYKFGASFETMIVSATLCVLFAFVSWKLVEYPALKLKKRQFFNRKVC